jgi:hypothetical protein
MSHRNMMTSLLCSIKASGILMHPANISQKIDHFIKLLEKRSRDVHMFTHPPRGSSPSCH